MYLSLNWLKDFVDIPKSITPEELGLKLTTHTVEIDGIKKQAENLDGVVVGEILEIKKHPNADKLRLVKVNIGEEKLDIVCGAHNIEVGQFVPVALVGAILPNGTEIKEAEIRGIKSSGMLCAEDELGLGKNHDGILILNKAKIGQKFNEHLKLDDVLFEVDNKSITNRPDLWSHYGMAREIAAFLNTKFKPIKNTTPLPPLSGGQSRIDVKVEDYKLCPRYMAIAMDGIKIEPSPEWMQKRLISVGMRPINNIVDITNYVMLGLGQPTHIFDFEKIKNMQILNSKSQILNKSQTLNPKLKTNIIIRNARDGEIIETLDRQSQKLEDSMLVIADSEKPIAVAGIMGGANSEVDDKTTSIIIESANFNPVSIRKTAQKLGLRSEASMRFEKSLDPNLCETALSRIVELIKEFCPQAEIISKLSDEKKYSLNQGPIELDLEWAEKRIGKKIEEKKIIEILENLGFKINKDTECPIGHAVSNSISVTTPTWRATKDISIPEDLVEEIARVYGYNNLNPEMPKITIKAPEINNERLLERKIKNILSVGAGLTEIYNYSFTSKEQVNKFGFDESLFLKLANPIASHQTLLRQNLFINLCENVKYNQAKEDFIAIYEIGSIFLNRLGDIAKDNKTDDKLPYQEKHLAIVLACPAFAVACPAFAVACPAFAVACPAFAVAGSVKNDNLFQHSKGVIAYLLNYLNCEVNFVETKMIPGWATDGIYANIEVAGKIIGWTGKLSSKTVSSLNIKKEIVAMEISLSELLLLVNQSALKYQELPKFPSVVRDLAFVISEKILYNDIKQVIIDFSPLISQVELFDVYQDDKLGLGKKNLAWHLTYQADRTLTSLEVDKVQSDLIKLLEKKFSAQIRDF